MMPSATSATTRRYPIGRQYFPEIRKDELLYVDKTAYIHRMAHGEGKYFFLSRPRRFGKSLLVSTLRSYFEDCEQRTLKEWVIEREEQAR